MVKSMTGFGRAEVTDGIRRIIVELKSVNHRYCDISTKLPKKFNCFDSFVRQTVKEYADRGKIDIFVSCINDADSTSTVKYNSVIASEYIACIKKMSEDLNLTYDISLPVLSRMPEVLTIEEKSEDPEDIKDLLDQALREACEEFISARLVEGEHLKDDILNKLDGLEIMIAKVEKRYPEMMEEYRKKLEDKLNEVLTDKNVSEQAVAAELVLYADKICVDEETVRLHSHIKNMRETLESGVNVGRKLDFLAQEMNREANTILSKANDISVSGYAIDIKTEIEKIREQIQNIE